MNRWGEFEENPRFRQCDFQGQEDTLDMLYRLKCTAREKLHTFAMWQTIYELWRTLYNLKIRPKTDPASSERQFLIWHFMTNFGTDRKLGTQNT